MDADTVTRAKKGLPIRSTVFYGWVIVAVSAMTMFFSGPGQTISVSVFVDSYIGEFGWSRTLVSSMYSMGTLTAGLLMGLVGGVFDRLGHRRTTTAVAVLFGLACLWMSRVESVAMLFAGFFLIRLLGQGSMGLSSSTLVPQWFVSKRGRAVSLVALGGILMSALLPPLNTWLIKAYGWRAGWSVWAVLLWVVMAPVAFLLIRDRPEEVGLWPDNVKPVHAGPGVEDEPVEESWTVREVLGNRSFWLLLFPMIVVSAVGTGLMFHQISIMGERGLSPEIAALVFSVSAVVRLPVGFLAGWAADKVQVRYLLAFSMATYLAAMIVLLVTNSTPLAMAYGVLRGVMLGILSILGGVLWPTYFGRRHLSGIRGVTMMAGVIGSALGPLPFGFAYDRFGGYREVIVASIFLQLLAILASLLAKPARKNSQAEPNTYA
ncbi:MFS transporter [Candidatus Bathyarchaeota archaeon]|nr:MAG: MFS transporter [Candidatus Bathyarchaeota archaeon]